MDAAPTLTAEMIAASPPEMVAFVNWLLRENARLQSRVTQLEAEVAELRNRLNKNSSNSSKPPSSDLPSHKPAPKKPPSGKRQGGQPGHQRNVRSPLPPKATQPVESPDDDAFNPARADPGPKLQPVGRSNVVPDRFSR